MRPSVRYMLFQEPIVRIQGCAFLTGVRTGALQIMLWAFCCDVRLFAALRCLSALSHALHEVDENYMASSSRVIVFATVLLSLSP